MKLRLVSVKAKEIDVVRKIVPRQDNLFDKSSIGSAGCPVDFQIFPKERLVVSELIFLAHFLQLRDDLLFADPVHVLIQKCVQR